MTGRIFADILPLALVLVAGGNSVPPAQSSLEEWKNLRNRAVDLYAGGDMLAALDLAQKAARFSTERFGAADWRAMADQFRLLYYKGAVAGSVSSTPPVGDPSAPSTEPLMEDIRGFFAAIMPIRARDLSPPGVSLPLQQGATTHPLRASGAARLALLIGNNDYSGPGVPKLRNAVNDARALRQALVQAGFSTTIVENASLEQMKTAIAHFTESLRQQPGAVALFYYSGHAIQIDSKNFLIPLDFNISDETGAVKGSYSLSTIHGDMVNAGAAFHIIILDACRNDRFASKPPQWFDLAPMPIAPNSFIAFSTAAGAQASDGTTIDENSPYAKRLLSDIAIPGLEIRGLFEKVKKEVMQDTASQQQKQVPWSEDDLRQDFYFYPPHLKWNDRDGLDYLLIPKGKFSMGCATSDNECAQDEKPRHSVTISSDFWIGRTEVTVGAYKLFVNATKRQLPAPVSSVNDHWRDNSHPIIKVSWNDADAFCRWSGGQLPTEAEWEYSARGGHDDQVYGESMDSQWRFTRPATESATNGFGLVGAAENVEEWVSDWYDPAFYSLSPDIDPAGPATGREKVVRGGSWAGQRRLSARLGTNPAMVTSNRGFRCVLGDAPTTALRSGTGTSLQFLK